jgi:hypothetical protein
VFQCLRKQKCFTDGLQIFYFFDIKYYFPLNTQKIPCLPIPPNSIFPSEVITTNVILGIKMLLTNKNKFFARNVHNLVYVDIIFIQKDNKSSKIGPPPPPPPHTTK